MGQSEGRPPLRGCYLMIESIALVVAVVVCMTRRVRRVDRFGRVRWVRSRPGRPTIRRDCGCPTRQHRSDCIHAGHSGRVDVGATAMRRAVKKAKKAARRVAMLRRRKVAALSGESWLLSAVAEKAYHVGGRSLPMVPFMWHRLTSACAVCDDATTHTVSVSDLDAGADEVRCLCRPCALAVERHH